MARAKPHSLRTTIDGEVSSHRVLWTTVQTLARRANARRRGSFYFDFAAMIFSYATVEAHLTFCCMYLIRRYTPLNKNTSKAKLLKSSCVGYATNARRDSTEGEDLCSAIIRRSGQSVYREPRWYGHGMIHRCRQSHNSDPARRRKAAVVAARLSLRPVNQSRESVLAPTARALYRARRRHAVRCAEAADNGWCFQIDAPLLPVYGFQTTNDNVSPP